MFQGLDEKKYGMILHDHAIVTNIFTAISCLVCETSETDFTPFEVFGFALRPNMTWTAVASIMHARLHRMSKRNERKHDKPLIMARVYNSSLTSFIE